MAAIIKFLRPPTFTGGPDEDVLDFVQRYESIGAYDGWADDEFRTNLSMYVDGAARKWFMGITDPGVWRNQIFVAANAAGAAAIPAVTGLRQMLINEFQQDNYALFQETKLRNRVQGENEETSGYYYDVLDLCRLVDPDMLVGTKLNHLYRGLRRSILEKVYPMQPATCEAFLDAVKVHSLAIKMAQQRDWSVPTSPSATAALSALILEAEPRRVTQGDSLIDALIELQSSVHEFLNDEQLRAPSAHRDPPDN